MRLGALETFTSIGARIDIGVTRLDLASCADAQGRSERVATHLRRAREVFAGLPAPRWRERVEALAAELTPLLPGSDGRGAATGGGNRAGGVSW
jgi:hypothetical protein